MLLTPQGWLDHFSQTGEHLHIYLDGEDVTADCYFADEESGAVGHYVRKDGGRYTASGGEVLTLERHGRVEIRPGLPLK
jgi:hypothetical protein